MKARESNQFDIVILVQQPLDELKKENIQIEFKFNEFNNSPYSINKNNIVDSDENKIKKGPRQYYDLKFILLQNDI